ncbi:hypothetical protein DFJ74DRAFT_723253 [Hyaloraphidium curvatum]|nr:hypothetical protein DFJ74DRAFT_723253 [Hyaloraphidium curvatum]
MAAAPKEDDIGRASSGLSEAEWLCLFPAHGKVPDALSGQPPPPDRAAAPRKLRPLSESSMSSVLRAANAPLALLFRLQRKFAHGARYLFEVMSLLFLVGIGIWASFWILPLDSHALAGLVRWLELCWEKQGDGVAVQSDDVENGHADSRGPPGVLLAHDDSDPLCPCPLPSCAGYVARRAAVLRILEVVAKSVGQEVLVVSGFTTLFAGAETWRTWWSILRAQGTYVTLEMSCR